MQKKTKKEKLQLLILSCADLIIGKNTKSVVENPTLLVGSEL